MWTVLDSSGRFVDGSQHENCTKMCQIKRNVDRWTVWTVLSNYLKYTNTYIGKCCPNRPTVHELSKSVHQIILLSALGEQCSVKTQGKGIRTWQAKGVNLRGSGFTLMARRCSGATTLRKCSSWLRSMAKRERSSKWMSSIAMVARSGTAILATAGRGYTLRGGRSGRCDVLTALDHGTAGEHGL